MTPEHGIVVHKAGKNREAFWGSTRSRPEVSKAVRNAGREAQKSDQSLADEFVKGTEGKTEESG